MGLVVCPMGQVAAPADVVWGLVQPAHWNAWIDGRVEVIDPPGPAMPGQVVRVSSRALARRWYVTFRVLDVSTDGASRHLEVQPTFPLGISAHERLTITALDSATSHLQYG